MKITPNSDGTVAPISDGSKELIKKFMEHFQATSEDVYLDESIHGHWCIIEVKHTAVKGDYVHHADKLTIQDINFVSSYDFWVRHIMLSKSSLILGFDNTQA